MTLLTPRPSYNLASTGGHESDRSLMSYIRGLAGSGEGLETVARSGKTVTAITAYFRPVSNTEKQAIEQTQATENTQAQGTQQADLFGDTLSDYNNIVVENKQVENKRTEIKPTLDSEQTENQSSEYESTKYETGQEVAIGVIYWLDSSSNSNNDRKDVWLVAEHHGSQLKDWLEQFHRGGSRGLKKWVKGEDNLDIYDSKKSYLAKIKRFFKVSEQAFTLLNKAVGLKQLNSIDEIFRQLVLDDVSTFKRAEEVIAQFDDLTQIKSTLEIAKRQQRSLSPLRTLHDKWQQQQRQLAHTQQMIATLPYWFAKHGQALWQQKVSQLTEQLNRQKQQHQQLELATEQQQNRYQSYFEKYHQQGGGELQRLSEQLKQQHQLVTKTKQHQQQYHKLALNLALQPAPSLSAFQQQQQHIEQMSEELQQQIDEIQAQMYAVGADKHALQTDISELQTQLAQAKAQKSNIPPKFEQFREQLAEHLQVDMGQLPYVAQLIEVQAEHSEWRGAIERALGSHRLRLLVPPSLIQPALHWVNHRDNRLHVRLYHAIDENKPAEFFADGFLRKLNFKEHSLREPLKQLLSNLDRHCVNSSDELQSTAHAMTKQGLMSSKVGWYDKQDQKKRRH